MNRNPFSPITDSQSFSINQALKDQKDIWRAISAVIAAKRDKSYVRADHKDT